MVEWLVWIDRIEMKLLSCWSMLWKERNWDKGLENAVLYNASRCAAYRISCLPVYYEEVLLFLNWRSH
jgi:hypothetical protein